MVVFVNTKSVKRLLNICHNRHLVLPEAKKIPRILLIISEPYMSILLREIQPYLADESKTPII